MSKNTRIGNSERDALKKFYLPASKSNLGLVVGYTEIDEGHFYPSKNNKARFEKIYHLLHVEQRKKIHVNPHQTNNLMINFRGKEKLVRFPPTIQTTFDAFESQFDAIITDLDEAVVSTNTADCIPLTIAEFSGKIIGVIHIGLVGAINKYIECILTNIADFVSISKIQFVFGPSINKSVYDLSKSGLWKAIEGQPGAQESHVGNFLLNSQNGELFDLEGAVVDQLLCNGVSREQIYLLGLQTGVDFYSNYFRKHNGASFGNFLTVSYFENEAPSDAEIIQDGLFP